MRPVIDYLIVIPKDEKFEYVREVVQHLIRRKVVAKTTETQVYAVTRLPTVSGDVSAVIISIGRMTEGPVQAAVEQALRIWSPAALLLIGIAGSLEPERVKLGDVIVPARVFGYTETKAES